MHKYAYMRLRYGLHRYRHALMVNRLVLFVVKYLQKTFAESIISIVDLSNTYKDGLNVIVD